MAGTATVQYELEFDDGKGGDLRVPIPDAGLGIGRATECEVRVNHPSVSRVHVKLKQSGDAVALEYLGSRRGIKVNGNRVSSANLRHGDSFQVGDRTFKLIDPEQSTSKPSGPRIPKALLDKHASNRLLLKRDPKSRVVFQRSCILASAKAEPAQLANEAMTIILQLLGAQRAFLLWFPQGEEKPRVLGSCSNAGRNEGPNLNGSLIAHMRAKGAPMLKTDERPLPADATGERPTAVCAPIRVNGQIVAAVYADSGFENGEFSTHALDDFRSCVQILGPMLAGIVSGVSG